MKTWNTHTMVENFKRTAVAAAALFALLFTACPNNAGGGGDSTVNITVKKVQGEGKVGTIPTTDRKSVV